MDNEEEDRPVKVICPICDHLKIAELEEIKLPGAYRAWGGTCKTCKSEFELNIRTRGDLRD